jgi:hypothetical protein
MLLKNVIKNEMHFRLTQRKKGGLDPRRDLLLLPPMVCLKGDILEAAGDGTGGHLRKALLVIN